MKETAEQSLRQETDEAKKKASNVVHEWHHAVNAQDGAMEVTQQQLDRERLSGKAKGKTSERNSRTEPETRE